MDAARFDTLAKRLAAPATRRQTLRASLSGGLLGALGLSRAVPDARAAQGRACVLDFLTIVRLGPNAAQVMTDGAQPGELRGELSFTLSKTGNLQDGVLLLADGSQFPVVGQATGHALHARVAIGPEVALVVVGVGEQEIAACQGAFDGLATGPSIGDIGDWHAIAQQPTQASQNTTNTPASQPAASVKNTPTPVPGPAPCAAGLIRCGSACVDLLSDENNCGACGAVCESNLVPVECRSGVCERANCPVGITYCGAVDGCRDLSSDPLHCGACQNVCPTNACTAGVCGSNGIQNCAPPFAVCSEGCVDLRSNFFNCGACDRQCQDDQFCQGSVCTSADPQCPAGTTDCGGYCADLLTSTVHCGACGNACGAGQPCQGGVCFAAPACAAGLTNCNGVCLDLQADPNNCGSCGVGCVSGVCLGGACTAPQAGTSCVAQGLTDCGGICVDLQTDAANCGACGIVCPQGPGYCVGGFCPQ